MEDETSRQFAMAKAMEKNRLEQEDSRAILLRQQKKNWFVSKTNLSERWPNKPGSRKRIEKCSARRRDSERWGLFAEATNQRSPFPSEQAAPTSRMENLMGVQQVPLARMYKGSTKRERREFMDEYLAYSRPSFEEITENDWCDYFLSAREVQELDLDSVAKAMASLKVDMKFCDAESRVGRLLADFYDKLEQLDVAHLPE
ncbi:hypothetical protein DYB38_010491, partial [Aphanomyces astaci]